MADIYAVVQAGSSAQSTTQKLADLLGLGSGQIVLTNATGAASFAGGNFAVAADGTISDPTSGNWQINPDGSTNFASGKILLNADGSASFASGVVTVTNDGRFFLPTISLLNDGTIQTPNITLFPDGSATFAAMVVSISSVGDLACATFNCQGAAVVGTLGLGSGNASIASNGTITGGDILCATLSVSGGNATIGSTGNAGVASLTVAGGAPLTGLLSTTAVLDFPNTLAQTSSDLTIAVGGAALGDTVSIGVPNASVMANSSYSAWVSAADTVTIRFTNAGALPRDPASGTFRATVFKF